MAPSTLIIADNTPEFHEFIRQLRNDDRIQDGFLERVRITPEQQQQYMVRLGDRYVVALLDGCPAGYAGSIDGDIRVCTHPEAQGKGVAKALILEIMQRFPESQARVKRDNAASQALFEACGFEHVGIDDGLLVYRLPAESAPSTMPADDPR